MTIIYYFLCFIISLVNVYSSSLKQKDNIQFLHATYTLQSIPGHRNHADVFIAVVYAVSNVKAIEPGNCRGTLWLPSPALSPSTPRTPRLSSVSLREAPITVRREGPISAQDIWADISLLSEVRQIVFSKFIYFFVKKKGEKKRPSHGVLVW